MEPRWKRFGTGLMSCIALAWLGYQALYGEGMLRIASAIMLVIGVVTTAGAILDHIRPRPKRRRSRERDAG
ncbi:hypothetical protein FRZ03_09690 [Streptomyces misionensis]|uniref:Uncharacterized protein n=1 Tax=Streptomyces misionensis TaxID=67331 RepID=A0A5C6JZR4_9ACTN|nr:hypothetical protein [Streptomyces misionensis]TWV53553.1 hypothetical protein FRZ03_09690 [Streptomyces misionensis]